MLVANQTIDRLELRSYSTTNCLNSHKQPFWGAPQDEKREDELMHALQLTRTYLAPSMRFIRHIFHPPESELQHQVLYIGLKLPERPNCN